MVFHSINIKIEKVRRAPTTESLFKRFDVSGVLNLDLNLFKFTIDVFILLITFKI